MLAGIDAIAGFVGGATSGSFAVDISDTEVTRTASTPGGSKTLTTTNITVTPSGGATPYTYSWVRTSGSALISANSPSGASTSFSATLTGDQEADAVFTCTVTDATGAHLAQAVFVDIELVSFA